MAEVIDFGSFQVKFIKDRHQTADALDMFELTLSPEGRMPVPHYHEDWEETVYGVEGTVTYTIGDVRHDIGPGESAFVPRNVVHSFSNPTDTVAKCLCVLTPGRLGPQYFRDLAAEVSTGSPDPQVISDIMKRYRLIPQKPR